MGACGPPGASRCSDGASLRTPSRPHPPLEDALRAIVSGFRAIPTFFAIGRVRARVFCAIGQPMVAKVAGQWAGTPKALGRVELPTLIARSASSCGGWGREGVRSTPKRGSPRGVGSELASGATTGPRGAAGPHNPDKALAGSAPPNPDFVTLAELLLRP